MGMKPKQLVGAVVRCLRANRAAMIWGSPGIGKTEIVFGEIGPALDNMPVWDFRANSKEPVDLRGLPYVDRDRMVTTWIVPEDLPREPAILFIDEINTVGANMQAPLYSICLERRLGNWTAHENTRIIAAGNRESDRAVAHRMSSALSTRFGHFELDPDPDQWCAWGSRSGRISATMIAFIRMRPNLLNAFDPSQRTSPTPRTVEAADHVWAQEPPDSTALEEIGAHVGEGFATEFLAFCKLWHQMPDIEDILRNPKTAPVPSGKDGMSIRFATAAALSRKMERKNMTNACVYLDRLGEEFSVFAVKDAYARDPDIAAQSNTAFLDWAQKHAYLLG